MIDFRCVCVGGRGTDHEKEERDLEEGGFKTSKGRVVKLMGH